MSLGWGKAIEVIGNGVVGIQDLDGVGDEVEGGIVPVVVLGKGGHHPGLVHVDDVCQLLLFCRCHMEGAEEHCHRCRRRHC